MRLLILTLLYILIPLSALSAPTDCKMSIESQYPYAWLDIVNPESCYCGTQLTNLTVTLPPGLRVSAVCGLSIYEGNNSYKIDLVRDKLSLDSYKKGRYPEGQVFLSGVIQQPITGTVRIEEGPAGRLWFNASSVNRRGPVFWEYHLKSLKLDTELDYKKLHATTLKTDKAECWEAEATIKIRNPVVYLEQTDRAGTHADFDVIRIADYKACPKRDMEHPEERLTKGQPKDVAELIHRIIGCNDVQGDWPYAEEFEKKQYAAEIVKFAVYRSMNQKRPLCGNGPSFRIGGRPSNVEYPA